MQSNSFYTLGIPKFKHKWVVKTFYGNSNVCSGASKLAFASIQKNKLSKITLWDYRFVQWKYVHVFKGLLNCVIFQFYVVPQNE